MTSASPDKRLLDRFSSSILTRPDLSAPLPPDPGLRAAQPPAAHFETDAPLAPAQFSTHPRARTLLRRLADFLRRPDTPSPFAIALLAPAGGGKTSALNWLAAQASSVPDPPPVTILRAADLVDEPERELAASLFRALSPRHAALAGHAAREGAHFGADAGAFSRSIHEKLDILRRKLLAERHNLAQAETQQASLTETLLYDTPGSRVDAYARRVRAGFEPRLRRFGFTGDAVAEFKDFTRDLAETGAAPVRALQSLRALYAFPGQIRLLVYAALSFGLSWGAGWLAANRPVWLNALGSLGAQAEPATNFLRDHSGWLPLAAQGLFVLGFALIGLNIWRAFQFIRPLLHAAGLLEQDLAAKRPEMEQNVAHHARSVDLLGAEVAALAEKAAEAERRAAAAGASRTPPFFLETDAAAQKRDHARGFLNAVSEAIVARAQNAPAKFIVAIDGFEQIAAPTALLDRLRDQLARPGFVTLFALDEDVFAGSRENLLRRAQLAVRIDGDEQDRAEIALASLDAPLSPLETRLLGALAPLAGESPRAQKRLRNLNRFLRPAPEAPEGFAAALAFFLAANLGASEAERQALAAALRDGAGDFTLPQAPRLDVHLAMAREISGPIGLDAARQARSLAEAAI